MLKIRSIVPVAALAILAACGGEEAEVENTDVVAEPVPAAVVTEPVTPGAVPVTDPAATTPATTMPGDTMAGDTGMAAGTTTTP